MSAAKLHVKTGDTVVVLSGDKAKSKGMIGKIQSRDLTRFMTNIVTYIRDKEHDFMAALAMCIVFGGSVWFFSMNEYEKNLIKAPLKSVVKKFKR